MATRKSLREDQYEHLLTCSICTHLYDDYDHQPKCLPCNHTFCKECLREYWKQMGEDINCPSCRRVATIAAAGVAALPTNIYVKHLQELLHEGPTPPQASAPKCKTHEDKSLRFFCEECKQAVCRKCCDTEVEGSCSEHSVMPLVVAKEKALNDLDEVFRETSSSIDRRRKGIKSKLEEFSEEKDEALMKVRNVFDRHAQVLNKRATLLKNKVIDSYSEHFEKMKNDLEELSTAMTCVISLKEYYELKIGQGNLEDAAKGGDELREVAENIAEKMRDYNIHISVEESHGIRAYKASVSDLGRVKCIQNIPKTATHTENSIRTQESNASTSTGLSNHNGQTKTPFSPSKQLNSPDSDAPDLDSKSDCSSC